MDTSKKVGILGGTLDPIHNGHIIMAEAAKKQLNLDEIIFMPSGNPPHKDINNITDAKIRLEMVKIAIENIDYMKYSDFELKRQGVIYTSDTLELYIKENPEVEIYFIMGADSLLAIESWYRPEKIFKLCNVIVADRDNSNSKVINKIEYLKNKYNASIFYLNMPLVDISSTYIRKCIKEKVSVKEFIPEKLEEFIIKNGIYK